MSAPEAGLPTEGEPDAVATTRPGLASRPLLSRKSLLSTLLEIALVVLPFAFFLAGVIASFLGKK